MWLTQNCYFIVCSFPLDIENEPEKSKWKLQYKFRRRKTRRKNETRKKNHRTTEERKWWIEMRTSNKRAIINSDHSPVCLTRTTRNSSKKSEMVSSFSACVTVQRITTCQMWKLFNSLPSLFFVEIQFVCVSLVVFRHVAHIYIFRFRFFIYWQTGKAVR